MQPSPPVAPVPTPSPRPRRRRNYIIASVVGLFLSTPFVFYFIAQLLSERELQAIHREIDQLDPDWRWPDLIAHIPPPPPDDQNAALLVLKVSDLLKNTPFNIQPKVPKKHPNVSLTEEQELFMRVALAKVPRDVQNEARKLQNMPEGRIPIDPAASPLNDTAFTNPVKMVELMHLLQFQAILAAHDGHLEDSAESILALLNSAHAINDYPMLMTQIIRHAGQQMAVETVERALGQGEISENLLAKLQSALAIEAEHNGLYYAMRGERAAGAHWFQEVREGTTSYSQLFGNGKSHFGGIASMFENWLAMNEYPGYLRVQSDLIQATKLSGQARADALSSADKQLEVKWSLLISGMRFYHGVFNEAQEHKARLRCAVVAVAAERFRLEHDSWPHQVQDLVKEGLLKEPLLDPYDNRPLRARRTPTGFLAYSVGADKIDNGGMMPRPGPAGPIRDRTRTFELWDPACRQLAPPAEVEAPEKKR